MDLKKAREAYAEGTIGFDELDAVFQEKASKKEIDEFWSSPVWDRSGVISGKTKKELDEEWNLQINDRAELISPRPLVEISDRLPDEKVKITYVCCKDCSFPVFASVNHLMDEEGKKQILELVCEGHTCLTVPLLEYRKIETVGWCDTLCVSGKIG